MKRLGLIIPIITIVLSMSACSGGSFDVLPEAKLAYDQGLETLLEAMDLDPNAEDQEKGRDKQARSYFDEAIRLEPDGWPWPYIQRARAYVRLGHYQTSLEDYDKAIRIGPGLAEPYTRRGILLIVMEKYSLAKKDLDKAIRIKPDYVGAYRHQGLLFGASGDSDKSNKDLDKAYELDRSFC